MMSDRGSAPSALKVGTILKDAIGYLPKAIIPGLVAILSTILYTRIFSPSIYGKLGLATAMAAPVLVVAAQIGGQPAGRYYNQFRKTLDEVTYRRTVAAFGLGGLLMVAGLGCIAIGVLLWTGLPEHLSWGLFLSLIVSTMVSSLTILFSPLLPADFQIDASRRVAIVSSVGSLGIALLFIWAYGRNVSFILWAAVFINLGTLPYILHRLQFSFNDFREGFTINIWKTELVSDFMKFGIPMAGWFFASALMSTGDRYILAIYHGTTAVGLYGTAYNAVNQGVQMASGPVLTATWPRVVSQWTKGNRDDAIAILRSMTSFYLVVGGYIVGGVAVVGHPVFSLLIGAKFVSAYPILLPVAAGTVLWQLAHLGHASLELVNKTKVMARNMGAATLFNFAANIILVPSYGLFGAAIAILVSYAFYVGLVWWTAKAPLPWSIDAKALLKACIAAVTAVMVSQMIPAVHIFGAAGRIIFLGMIYSACYFLVILSFNRLRRAFRGGRVGSARTP